jgi:hypothetical protein
LEQIVAHSSGRRQGGHMLTIISLMVLIGVEVFAVALSGGWAIAGLFELGDYVGYALMAVFGIGAAWLMLQLWHKAMHADPNV